jgi:flagellar biosynthetic protein FliP
MKRLIVPAITILLALLPWAASAAGGVEALTVKNAPGGGQTYSLSVQVLIAMTALSLAPAALMLTTSFTRIIIVLAILRQALGTLQTPPNQVLIGLALFLTFFIMSPVFQRVYDDAVKPWMDARIEAPEAMTRGSGPLKEFMLGQTRESDIALFSRLSGKEPATPETTPISILVPAFATSELKTAFQIGFLIFIPFLIIDLVVASVLMSMGMVMLSPQTVSFPFKLMLFVVVDGWSMIMGTLASSFYV